MARRRAVSSQPGSRAVASPPHLRRRGNATQLIVDGKPFIMLAGELHNSSASSLDYMAPIWERMAALGLNTVLAPLYWESIEPDEGRFDFSLVDGLIDGARAHGQRLVFLWFATWKNAVSSYAPAWVKTDGRRFFRAHLETGERAHTISALSREACEADARAFAAVMRHIRQADGRRRTVLMMQVENETGILKTPRDHSPAAEAAFRKRVPDELMSALAKWRDELTPEFKAIWAASDFRESGTWFETFGGDADEVFMAWHTSRYVDRVAAAGKAEYGLPMYANAWLVHPNSPKPGQYPSGGPVPKMLDVWRAGAPHVDALAPDIYLPDFRSMCAAYAKPWNPLVIPEARRDERCAATAFYALAEHDAVCFAPFGIDDLQPPHPLADTYRLLAEIAPLLADHHGQGTMAGFCQQADKETWERGLGGFHVTVEPRSPLQEGAVPAGGLIVALAPDEFLIAGRNLKISFTSRDPERPNTDYLWLDEGRFEKGKWIPGRRLNGDESGHGRWVSLDRSLKTLKVKVYCY